SRERSKPFSNADLQFTFGADGSQQPSGSERLCQAGCPRHQSGRNRYPAGTSVRRGGFYAGKRRRGKTIRQLDDLPE
ncbi:MAG TPA: hypothetical protein VER03_26585, partial [Bryobacteraceae bacterium]|nr:hypothetical protein [Bryobacteraceae bacterium]